MFYHRQTGLDEFSRQAMVAPIEVQVTEGIHGKVYISEGEYTSEGFATQGLNPFKRHSAGITCYYTGPKPAIHNWPNKTFFGSYVKPLRLERVPQGDPYDLSVNHNPVINNTDGSTIGYKYFNFDYTYSVPHLQLKMNVLPLGVDATIEVYVDSPYPSRGGKLVGEFKLSSSLAKKITELKTDVPALSQYQGKHALFFVVKSAKKEKSVCELHDFVFTVK